MKTRFPMLWPFAKQVCVCVCLFVVTSKKHKPRQTSGHLHLKHTLSGYFQSSCNQCTNLQEVSFPSSEGPDPSGSN